MERISPGKYIELGYDLYRINPDGSETLVHQTDKEDPERIIFGVTPGVIAPLERALQGLAAGDKFDVKATADQAFGHYDKENVVELDKEVFEVDGKFDDKVIKAGAHLPMMTADGFHIDGVVVEVTPSIVKMDFNHPLVDRDVRFKGVVLAVRDATPEEIHPSGGCGCGCHHGHDDGDGCCHGHEDGQHCHNHHHDGHGGGCCHGDGDGDCCHNH